MNIEKMTDEEKAEEYVKTNHSHIMSGTMKSIYKKIYLDGLAEGRKEKCTCVHTDNSAVIASLEKENAKLEAKLSNLCNWQDDISSVLDDIDDGKYKDNEHQAFVDLYTILDGVHGDILNTLRG